MYGRTEDEWDELREAAEYYLVTVTRDRGMTDYSTLNRQIAQDTEYQAFDFGQESERAAIGRLLGEISVKTHAEHGIMLPALVTHPAPTTKEPGSTNSPLNSGESRQRRRRMSPL